MHQRSLSLAELIHIIKHIVMIDQLHLRTPPPQSDLHFGALAPHHGVSQINPSATSNNGLVIGSHRYQ